MINFNVPPHVGDEEKYIAEAIGNHKICGDGPFCKRCSKWFEELTGTEKALLTTSCTHATEMAAILTDIKPGDEVIMPSYTFVSSALAFTRQGAKIVFADSEQDTPNMDVSKLERLITPKTKAIVPVHYAGVAVDMDPLIELTKKYGLFVIEDAAQAIDSYYKSRPLGSIGDLGCFSFHDTKNITAGEGGMLVINNPAFIKRAEILWEKGTNRSEFFRGEVNKYGWVDTGSSFLPSELNAALLFSQLEEIKNIQSRRLNIWNRYFAGLKDLADKGYFRLPVVPEYATNNAHMFYLVCNTPEDRTSLITHLKENGIHAVFHYLSLHKSIYISKYNPEKVEMPMSDIYTEQLVRLPLFFSMTDENVDAVVAAVREYYNS